MKKRVVIFIAVIIIAIIGVLFINQSFIEDSKDYLKGILEANKPQNISIFMLPAVPILTIISPENITYSASTILLNYSVRNAETIWYSLDGMENITLTSPLYFNAAEGSHILYLHANNSLGESVRSVTFSIQIETAPSGEGGGSGGGTGEAGETPPLKENLTSPETSTNVTEQEIPENITKEPEEKPTSTREITIKFLTILLFLVLLIILVVFLIVRIKRKLKKKLSLKKRLWREKEKKKK